MMRICHGAVLALAVIGLAACGRNAGEHSYRLFVFGTLVDITTYDAQRERSDRAVQQIEAAMQQIDHDWHAWRPGPFTELNARLAAGETVTLDTVALGQIRRAAQLSATSHDLFNPAIGKLIAVWGFHNDDAPSGPPPTPPQIYALLSARPTMKDLVFGDGNTLRSTNPSLQLDFGGYTKALAIDTAIAILQRHKIHNAIVNIGGDMRTIGRHGLRHWRIGIRHPQQPGAIASIETADDECIFTSGTYERYFEYQGQTYHHLIDPRNGQPARGVLSVTVLHKDPAVAETAAKAILIAGVSQWQYLAREMGVKQVLVIDQNMQFHATAQMASRVKFEITPTPDLNISKTVP
ncbi:MAG: FAD:protein FMN transferase [Gammaproteobacteria bacterium]|nr:FAD:protein FMN transferase [Gammaproteobacteria bacterium]